MRLLLPPLLCLAQLAAADPLTDSVFELGAPDRAPAAEKRLEAAGAKGLELLLLVARAGGDETAVGGVAAAAGCPHGAMLMGVAPPFNPTPASRAATLLGRLLKDKPAERARLASSSVPIERAIAIAAAVGSAGDLEAALSAAAKDPSPTVVQLVQRLGFCQRLPGAGSQLMQRSLELGQQEHCATPAAREKLARAFAEQRAQTVGWSGNRDTLQVSVKVDETSGSIAAECALAVYDAAVKLGTWPVGLLEPLAKSLAVPAPMRRLAGQRLERDLEHVPSTRRDDFTALLINAGLGEKLPFQLDERFPPSHEKLEAALRRRLPTGRAALEQSILCGTFTDARLALLGFVDGPSAVERAVIVVQRCGRDGLGYGTAALLRLRAPQGLELLEGALGQQTSLARDVIEQAALESFEPKLEEKLRTLAAGDGLAASEARRILGHALRDGLTARPAPTGRPR